MFEDKKKERVTGPPISSGEGKKPAEMPKLTENSIKSNGFREAQQKPNPRESMVPPTKKPRG